MKYKITFILLFNFIVFSALNAKNSHSDLQKSLETLDREIEQRNMYVQEKQQIIDSLKNQLKNNACSEACKYDLYLQLSDQYRSFIYDSALVYTQDMLESAQKLRNTSKEKESKIKLAFILLSSGLFQEAREMIDHVDVKDENIELRLEYFSICARVYYDLSDYTSDSSYHYKYKEKGNMYQDSVIKLQENQLLYLAAVATREMKSGNPKSAIGSFEQLLQMKNLSYHEVAIAASSLGYLYSLDGEYQKAMESLILASIADIKSVTKETVALRNLASMLFEYNDDFDRAYHYIYVAYEDAKFYNAKHRLAEVRTILPIIQRERIKMIEEQRNQYIRFSIALSLLFIVGVMFLVIIIKQNKKQKDTKNLILKSNLELQKINAKLQESNKIKEEYIGYFFRVNSDFIQKQTSIRRKVLKLIQNKEFDKLKNVVSDEELEEQRMELYKSFDKIFLKIFPSFIDDFNSLFRDEDKIRLPKSELLNTDLRIYALIRLGIRDNEDIAEFLNYSVNTIYTYKTKIKNKSIIENEDFDKEIMKIKAI